MYCIETKSLSHRFATDETVLHDVNLKVPQGSVYGFLGPNGAGKTTTLKLILGLLQQQEGEISVFGKSFSQHRVELLKNIGSLIESPSLYGHLSAAENLEVFRRIYRCPEKRSKEVLEIVGLQHTGKKRAGKFSLGMKQRLGIAIALLNNPSLLVLDEPTNGLDPNGIIEIRELLKQLNADRKITIVISSHLLSEIEKMVTHVGIINKGSLLFQGTMEELHQRQQQGSAVLFETNDTARTAELISQNNYRPVIEGSTVSIPFAEPKHVAHLNRQLVNKGIELYQVRVLKNDLETIFMDLIK